MKTTDLMIGDLVYRNGKYEPMKVLTIGEHGCCLGFTDGYCGEAEDLIEPILLTSEILEKNYGKEMRVGISDKPCWGEMGAIWMTMLWKCENSFWLEVSTIADGWVKKHILYVHELQHALRLAGIKKEIVL